jgi:hypothetical protein
MPAWSTSIAREFCGKVLRNFFACGAVLQARRMQPRREKSLVLCHVAARHPEFHIGLRLAVTIPAGAFGALDSSIGLKTE